VGARSDWRPQTAWCAVERRGLGRPTPAGVIPLVPAAVVLTSRREDAAGALGPQEGYAACEASVGTLALAPASGGARWA
jgi:hypothetical protein